MSQRRRPRLGSSTGTLSRRALLGAAATGLSALAGCAGGGDGTDAIPAADVGPYGDWSVAVDGADWFVLTYVTDLGDLLAMLPSETAAGFESYLHGTGERPLNYLSHDDFDPSEVGAYFEGATESGGNTLRYIRMDGPFDANGLREQLPALPRDFEATGETVGEYEVFRWTEHTPPQAIAVREGRLLWVTSDVSEVEDPVGRAVDAIEGTATPYTAVDESFYTLIDALQSGQFVETDRTAAPAVGAVDYGRQFVVGQKRARPEEVYVFEEPVEPDAHRDAIEANAPLYDSIINATIDELRSEGRTLRVVYEPVDNALI
jgi:hypothetical protein